MPKRVDNIFGASLTFKKMYDAYKRAAKGKKKNKEVILFELNLASNLIKILKEINSGKYELGEYRKFYVYEPKKREVQALPFRDRVVHQWYVEEYIKPIFVPKFVKDSYACIEGRGTVQAISNLKKYMRAHINIIIKTNHISYEEASNRIYVLKCDIRKFFYNIDKGILYNIISKSIKDKRVLSLTKTMIYSNQQANEVGIPIGNYTSQFFANIYLNELDHFVKEKLGVKYYARYMDDFVLLLKNKEECKIALEKIKLFLEFKLKLELNQKTMYFKIKQGVTFLGFRVFDNHVRLSSTNKRRIYKRIKRKNKIYEIIDKTNKEEVSKLHLSYVAWKGHAIHANTKVLIDDIETETNWIYKG